jgi:hypothetical protein
VARTKPQNPLRQRALQTIDTTGKISQSGGVHQKNPLGGWILFDTRLSSMGQWNFNALMREKKALSMGNRVKSA